MARISRASELDDVDRRLLELLSADGRVSNRALAAEVGLLDATVAARIRRLRDAGVVGVTAVFDWEAVGYDWSALVFVEVDGRLPRAVAADLAEIAEVLSVALVFGTADLVLLVIAPSRAQLTELVTQRLPRVVGVKHVTSDMVLDVALYRWTLATLPLADELTIPFADALIELDELDESLARELVKDGRQSNREIARTLGVSDGTIRTRIKRMEDAGLMRIVAQTDPVALGTVGAMAYVGIEVDSPPVMAVAEELATWSEVVACFVSTGRESMHVVVATPDTATLGQLVADRMLSLPGVRRTNTWPVVEVVKHVTQMVRLIER